MKMIDVLSLMAEGEINENTKLIIYDDLGECSFRYSEKYHKFISKYSNRLEDFGIGKHFLNLEVELIPPKEKKYFVKFNMRWWIERFSYLNYYEKNESIELNTKQSSVFCKASFTKSELQSIQPVREFLEDMEGKYELIEVND